MHTTIQLIELAKQRLAQTHGLELPMSNYRFEKLTGFQQPTISKWTSGKSRIGMEFAGRFAELTGLSAAYVLACLEHERHSDPSVRQIFADIAEAFRGKAAALVMACLAAGLSFAPAGNQAHASAFNGPGYALCASRRRRLRAWLRFFTVFPVAALATAGCASITPNAARLELEHVSHPLAGWPQGPRDEEDGLTQANAILRWQRGRFYVEHGVGYNLKGENGGGFYGPGLTYTGRVGVEFSLGGAR